MRLYQHIIASTAFGAAVYGVTGSSVMAGASLVSGILIDVDHLLDYWRDRPFSICVKDFFAVCEGYRLTRVYLWIHSLELIVPFSLLAWFTRSPLIIGLVLGWAQHILLDHMANSIHSGTYFFFWRMRRSFNNASIFVIPNPHEAEKRTSCGL